MSGRSVGHHSSVPVLTALHTGQSTNVVLMAPRRSLLRLCVALHLCGRASAFSHALPAASIVRPSPVASSRRPRTVGAQEGEQGNRVEELEEEVSGLMNRYLEREDADTTALAVKVSSLLTLQVRKMEDEINSLTRQYMRRDAEATALAVQVTALEQQCVQASADRSSEAIADLEAQVREEKRLRDQEKRELSSQFAQRADEERARLERTVKDLMAQAEGAKGTREKQGAELRARHEQALKELRARHEQALKEQREASQQACLQLEHQLHELRTEAKEAKRAHAGREAELLEQLSEAQASQEDKQDRKSRELRANTLRASSLKEDLEAAKRSIASLQRRTETAEQRAEHAEKRLAEAGATRLEQVLGRWLRAWWLQVSQTVNRLERAVLAYCKGYLRGSPGGLRLAPAAGPAADAAAATGLTSATTGDDGASLAAINGAPTRRRAASSYDGGDPRNAAQRAPPTGNRGGSSMQPARASAAEIENRWIQQALERRKAAKQQRVDE